MATDPTAAGGGPAGADPARGGLGVRRGDGLGDETKQAFKTTEFIAYVALLAAIFIAGLVSDDFGTSEVWLYATILTFGYMVSRGIAKSGSRHRD